jgi:serine/threonine protein kinase
MCLGDPFLPGDNDVTELQLIADKFGPILWPGCEKLPGFMRFTPHVPPIGLGAIFSAERGDAVDLLARMFVLDPSERITAEEALRHPYFQSLPSATLPSDLPVMKELKNKAVPLELRIGTGMMTGVGGITTRTKYAPGTTILKAQATTRIVPK